MPTEEPQHMTALQRANEVRLGRAALKREVAGEQDVARGRARLAALLEDPPSALASLPIGEALLWPRRHGRRTVGRFLVVAGCREHKRVGELTERQRRAIAVALRHGPQEAMPWR